MFKNNDVIVPDSNTEEGLEEAMIWKNNDSKYNWNKYEALRGKEPNNDDDDDEGEKDDVELTIRCQIWQSKKEC